MPPGRRSAGAYDMYHLMDAVETVNHFTFLALMFNSLGVQPDEGLDRSPAARRGLSGDVPEPEPPLKAARVEPEARAGIAVGPHVRAAREAQSAARTPANFINQVSKLTPRASRDADPPHWMGLPIRVRMGASTWDRRPRARPRRRSRPRGTWAGCAGHRSVRCGAPARGRRALSRRRRSRTRPGRRWARGSIHALIMSAVYTVESYRATSMSLRAYGVQLEEGDERFRW